MLNQGTNSRLTIIKKPGIPLVFCFLLLHVRTDLR